MKRVRRWSAFLGRTLRRDVVASAGTYAALWVIVTLCGSSGPLRAEHSEPYETPETSWRLVDRDCPSLRVIRHDRLFHGAHTGLGCEYLHIAGDLGTYVHYGQPVPAVMVVDPLTLTVWVRSNRPGIQLLARVVLPQTRRATDGKPVVTFLRGGVYDQTGQWQALTLSEPLRQLRRQEPSLRFEHGPRLDIRGAFLDMAVLNVYGGRGETEVWVDDLSLTGEVILASVGDDSQQGDPSSGGPSNLTLDDGVFLSGGRARFLRGIEYRGEPCQELARLGFNCLWMSTPPTRETVNQARAAGLWLIAPYPPETPVEERAVPGWVDLLGQPPTAPVGSAAGVCAVLPQLAHRPSTLAACWFSSLYTPWASQGQMVLVELPTIASGMELSELGSVFHQQVNRVTPAPVLAVLPSQPHEALYAQLHTLARELTEKEVWCEPEQLRLMAVHAMASGARGIIWRSQERLDTDSPATQLRKAQLQWLNCDMEILEPFLAAGRAVGLADVGNRLFSAYLLQTERAQMVVLVRPAAEQQMSVSGYVTAPARFTVPVHSSSPRVYHVTSAGLVQLVAERVAGGVSFTLDYPGLVNFVVITQEPAVMAHLADAARRIRRQRAQAMVKTLELALAVTRENTSQRSQVVRATSGHIRQAETAWEAAERMYAAEDVQALERYVSEGLQALCAARRECWERSARAFPISTSSPATVLFSTLPWHDVLLERWQPHTWSGNVLAGGEMENLEQMLQAGWQRRDYPAVGNSVDVRLSSTSVRSGMSSLQIRAGTQNRFFAGPGITQPVVEIVTPAVPLRMGQVVQVRGWARVVDSGYGSAALWIEDSLTGPMLASQIRPSPTWTPWMVYRAAPRDGTFRLHFQVYGAGEVWLDDVSAHILLESPPSN